MFDTHFIQLYRLAFGNYIRGGIYLADKKIRQKHEEDLKKLKAFRLMDDDFMTACFDGHPECVELILCIIMEKPDLVVLDVKVQHFIKNLQKRSVRLDVFATDSKGKKYNIEIQREDKGAGAKRARFNSSLIDSKIMETGTDFDDLPETFVIFITEKDVLGEGRPLYHIERYIMESEKIFDDKAHIIYVNGEYRGNNPLGYLMADFNCTEPSKMYYNKLKERVAYFKETKEGVAIMCKAIEEMRAQEREEGRLEGQQELLLMQIHKKAAKGKTLEQIAEELEETVEVILPLYQKILAEH